MILNDRDIRSVAANGEIRIDPFSDEQIQPASYDLRVGSQGLTTSSNSLIDIRRKGFLELRPGDFGIIITRETIEFNNSHVARIGLRSRYARKGIIATTGPQVDPGFKGRLKIGVMNLSPHVVSFPFEDDFITLEIHRLSEPSENPYSGPYQGMTDLSPEDISVVTEGDNIGFAKMLDSLRSLSANVNDLADSVKHFTHEAENLRTQYKHILWAIGGATAFISLLISAISITSIVLK